MAPQTTEQGLQQRALGSIRSLRAERFQVDLRGLDRELHLQSELLLLFVVAPEPNRGNEERGGLMPAMPDLGRQVLGQRCRDPPPSCPFRGQASLRSRWHHTAVLGADEPERVLCRFVGRSFVCALKRAMDPETKIIRPIRGAQGFVGRDGPVDSQLQQGGVEGGAASGRASRGIRVRSHTYIHMFSMLPRR